MSRTSLGTGLGPGASRAGLQGLLPATVAVEHTTVDVEEGVLLPTERACVAAAVQRRRTEFATGRWCARRALHRIGYPAAPILPGRHREPLWPDGVTGSMTHCDGFRAAAVCRTADHRGLGIDAEPNVELPPGVLALVAGERERRMLDRLADREPRLAWDRLLFSAKESIFKVWFPLTGCWLDFTQCDLSIGRGTYRGQIYATADATVGGRQPRRIGGRWVLDGHHLLTASVV